MDLSSRVLEGELMDAPDLAPSLHRNALRGLQRVNWFSGTANVLAEAICQSPSLRELRRTIRILDLACGGGDVTLALAEQLQRRNMGAHVTGWDRSPTAIEFAQTKTKAASPAIQVDFCVADALSAPICDSYDVVCCTLFLHHLSDEQAQVLLLRMVHAARHLVLIDDLRRSQLGYALAWVGCRLLSRSPIVHVDGPLSVRAAFTHSEIIQLAVRCQLPAPSIRHHWPQRFLLAWSGNGA